MTTSRSSPFYMIRKAQVDKTTGSHDAASRQPDYLHANYPNEKTHIQVVNIRLSAMSETASGSSHRQDISRENSRSKPGSISGSRTSSSTALFKVGSMR